MGIYDRDYMKRTGNRDPHETGSSSVADKLENLARNLLFRKRLLKIVGMVLLALILTGLILTRF